MGAANASEAWMTQLGTRSGMGAFGLHNGSLFAPNAFMFAVDRASALARSRKFLRANYKLCKRGVRVLPAGVQSWPEQAPFRNNMPGQNDGTPGASFNYNPKVWGHVNERLPFHLFGRDFRELPIPECIWQGGNADMNCTQTGPSMPLHLLMNAMAHSSTLRKPSGIVRSHKHDVQRAVSAETISPPQSSTGSDQQPDRKEIARLARVREREGLMA